jgi:glycerol-3-phosphate dehydrogenase (NAD(P)+)
VRISVLGAGAWGTALASHASPRNEVLLWARDAQQAEQIGAEHCNRRYLPEIELPSTLRISGDLDAAIAHALPGLVVVATPMAALAQVLAALPAQVSVVWLSKGFDAGTGRLGHEVARDLRPQARVSVLSGPSFAIEVARRQPTALVVASNHAALSTRVVEAFHADSLRIYTSDDVIGVEVGGAVKNVMAIAAGIADGMRLGLNARAALITRGLAEMTRLGAALGARAETFMGLSGLGDLVLTTTGDLSRNRQVGLRLAQGETLDGILRTLGHVAEGVYSAAIAAARARALAVEIPITEAVVDVLEGRLSPREALDRLMGREARTEH